MQITAILTKLHVGTTATRLSLPNLGRITNAFAPMYVSCHKPGTNVQQLPLSQILIKYLLYTPDTHTHTHTHTIAHSHPCTHTCANTPVLLFVVCLLGATCLAAHTMGLTYRHTCPCPYCIIISITGNPSCIFVYSPATTAIPKCHLTCWSAHVCFPPAA